MVEMTYRSSAIDTSCGIRHTALAAEERKICLGRGRRVSCRQGGGGLCTMIDLSAFLGGLVGLVRGGRMVFFGLDLLSQSGGYRVCPVLGLHRFWRSVPTYLTGKGPIGPCGYAMGVASGETGLQARLLGLLQNVEKEDDSTAVPKLGSGLRLRGLTSSSSKGLRFSQMRRRGEQAELGENQSTFSPS